MTCRLTMRNSSSSAMAKYFGPLRAGRPSGFKIPSATRMGISLSEKIIFYILVPWNE